MTSTASQGQPEPLITHCGRRIRVGQFHAGGASPDSERVTLDVGPERDGDSRIWASLSPGEARNLAQLLIEHADRAEAARI